MTAGVLLGMMAIVPGIYAQSRLQPVPQAQKADTTRPDTNIEKQRQQILASIETELADAASDQRWVCATGLEPQRVREARAEGRNYEPDASKSCPIVVQRELRNGHGMELYERIAQLGGKQITAQQVLAAVQKAALNNEPQVPLGGGKAIPLTPALAADAGTLVGLTDNTLTPESLHVSNSQANLEKLRVTEESCLDGNNPNPLSPQRCFLSAATRSALEKAQTATVPPINDPAGKSR